MEEKRGGFMGLFGRKKKDKESDADEQESTGEQNVESEVTEDEPLSPLLEPAEETEESEQPEPEMGPDNPPEMLTSAEEVEETESSETPVTGSPSAPAAQEEDLVGETPTDEAMPKRNIFTRFRDKLRATHDAIFSRVEQTFSRTRKVDDDLFDDLEEILITADVGVETSLKLIEDLRDAARRERRERRDSIDWLKNQIEGELKRIIGTEKAPLNVQEGGTTIILIVGVNGTGKTTAIGKMAHRFRQEGKRVMLVAGDTFRAAAIDQLATWAERAGAEIVRGQEGSDPGAIIFDAVQSARSKKPDIVLIDTAGRLHTKSNLMKELQKIGRIISREFPDAPHETLLVLDASTGHNGLQQAKVFAEAVPLTGIVLNKLDGTAKGGVTIAVHHELDVPVKLVGLGEKITDLDEFDPQAFVSAILN